MPCPEWQGQSDSRKILVLKHNQLLHQTAVQKQLSLNMMVLDIHDLEAPGKDLIVYNIEVKRSNHFGLAFLRFFNI